MAMHSESTRVVSQFLLKSLHIILDSRIPSLRPRDHSGDLSTGSSSSRAKKSDKWFHLALGDRPAALDNLYFWHRNVMDPMIIDIILVREGSGEGDMFGESDSKGQVETVIERWVVQYEALKGMVHQSSESLSGYKKTYKKSIVLLRSLYSTMRLLPAYKVFRQLCLSNQTYNFDINYKVSTFSEPFSREEEDVMKHYSFFPVEAHPGRLSISVLYHPTLSDFNLEGSPSLPTQIITDYVGSPATDPFKVFTSTERGLRATSFPSRGINFPSSSPFERPQNNFPSSSPFERPHSWTSGLHKAAPFAQNHPINASPAVYPGSRTPDYSPSPPDIYNHRISSNRTPTHKKGTSFDEYQLSPPFSPSPSPSPPTYFSTGTSSQTRYRSESAPVNIPLPLMGRNSRYLTPSSSDPNRHSLPPMSPRSTKPDLSSQESGNRSFRKMDAQRLGELYSGISNLNLHSGQKLSKDYKDDSGRFSGLVSSSGSPRIGFSRSSSRLSFQDDLDDGDFSCPFAVDDVDTSDSQSRTLDGKDATTTFQTFSSTRKSQDAAIGVLVHMLKTAPPLRQDHSCYSSQSSKTEFAGEVGASSGFFIPRKTSDALEELRSFKEMKDLLLSQSGTREVNKDNTNPASSVA